MFPIIIATCGFALCILYINIQERIHFFHYVTTMMMKIVVLRQKEIMIIIQIVSTCFFFSLTLTYMYYTCLFRICDKQKHEVVNLQPHNKKKIM